MNTERKIIHDMLNCLNSMKLNCACLPLFSRSEVVGSMESIELSAQRLEGLLIELYEVRGHAFETDDISTDSDEDAGYDSPPIR